MAHHLSSPLRRSPLHLSQSPSASGANFSSIRTARGFKWFRSRSCEPDGLARCLPSGASETYSSSRTPRCTRMYNLSMCNLQSLRRAFLSLAVTSVILASTMVAISFRSPVAGASTVVPLCEGSNLVGAFVSNQVATGHVMVTVAITNVGTTSCELGGYPNLIGLRGARQFKLRITGHGTNGGNLLPTTLAPRMSGALIVGTDDMCSPYYGVIPPGHAYLGVIVVLPQGAGWIRVPDVSFDTTCGLTESQLGWRNNFSIEGV